MIHPDKAIREAGMRRLAVLAAACAPMGTRLITLCTGTRDPDDQWRWHPDNASPDAWADLVTEMDAAVALADRFDIDLGIEPELANVVSDAPAARRLLDEMASPRLRIVLDPANLFERAEPAERRRLVEAAADTPGPRNRHGARQGPRRGRRLHRRRAWRDRLRPLHRAPCAPPASTAPSSPTASPPPRRPAWPATCAACSTRPAA